MAEEVARARPLRRALGRLKKRWRVWMRATHRDVGYLIIGLTFVYAISGLALNHIETWNSNYTVEQRTVKLRGPLPAGEAEATREVLRQLGIDARPRIDDIFMAGDELSITLGKDHQIQVNLATNEAHEDYQKPRFFLRMANWMHVQRGKPAWNYIGDSYAVLLLFLASSGAFMLRGRKGLIGRGGILIAIGIAVPIAYVVWSGGP